MTSPRPIKALNNGKSDSMSATADDTISYQSRRWTTSPAKTKDMKSSASSASRPTPVSAMDRASSSPVGRHLRSCDQDPDASVRTGSGQAVGHADLRQLGDCRPEDGETRYKLAPGDRRGQALEAQAGSARRPPTTVPDDVQTTVTQKTEKPVIYQAAAATVQHGDDQHQAEHADERRPAEERREGAHDRVAAYYAAHPVNVKAYGHSKSGWHPSSPRAARSDKTAASPRRGYEFAEVHRGARRSPCSIDRANTRCQPGTKVIQRLPASVTVILQGGGYPRVARTAPANIPAALDVNGRCADDLPVLSSRPRCIRRWMTSNRHLELAWWPEDRPRSWPNGSIKTAMTTTRIRPDSTVPGAEPARRVRRRRSDASRRRGATTTTPVTSRMGHPTRTSSLASARSPCPLVRHLPP